MNVTNIIICGGLAVFAAWDVRYKLIPIIPVVVLSILLMIFSLLSGKSIMGLAAGMIPGCVLLLLAICTDESIGIGDGMIVCMVGAGCGLTRTVTILGVALMLSAVLSMVLLCIGRVEKKTELPFLPSVFLGFIAEWIW